MFWILLGCAGAMLAAAALVRKPLLSWHAGLGRGLVFGFSGLAGILYGAFHWAELDLERDAWLLWIFVASASALVSALMSARWKRAAGWELVGAVTVVVVLASAALQREAEVGLASASFRALLVAPPVMLLCGYFGSSLGFLLRGSGNTESSWSYEARIGRRFLLSKASTVISTVTTISVVGVCLGVAAVIFSLAVLAGFENDLRQKIIATHAHAVIQRTDHRPFVADAAMQNTIDETDGVVDRAPVIEREVAIASRSNYTGALVLGIDPTQSRNVLNVLSQITAGSVEPIARELVPASIAMKTPAEDVDDEFPPPAPLPNIVIGEEMARNLSVQTGDTVRMLSPTLGTLTPVGLAPKSLGFRVAGVFSSEMYEYDAKLAFISSAAARAFFELPQDAVTGLMLSVNDPDRSDRIGASLLASLGGAPFAVLDWKFRNQALFAALKLERVVSFVIVAFIILVASFSIVNTLTMSIIEKRREIAILKTMGARDVGIMKVFLVQGLTVGAFGALLGTLLGLSLIAFFKAFGFWIPDDVYYIDSLPIYLDPLDAILVVAAALLIVWNFSVFPALRGSKLTPVEGLRDG